MSDQTLANVHAVCCPPHLTVHLAAAADVSSSSDIKALLEATRTLDDYNGAHVGLDLLKPVPATVLEKVQTNSQTVYLTFDDGPYEPTDRHETSTRELMEILKAKGAKATFFCQGFWSFQNGDLLNDIVAAGHNLGNHTYHHPPDGHSQGPILGQQSKFALLKPAQQIQEILWARAGMVKSLGDTKGLTRYFRSPHGSGVTPAERIKAVVDRIASVGHITVNGHLGLSDARADLSRKALETTYRSYFSTTPAGARKGEILWLHSGLKATTQALPDLIDILTNRGYKVSALP